MLWIVMKMNKREVKYMEEVMSKITDEVIEDIENKDIKQIVIEHKEPRTIEQELAIESIKEIKNPFIMISADYVMKDLGLCRNKTYSLFRQPDFPSISIGKKHKVMFLAYIMWKLNKKGKII